MVFVQSVTFCESEIRKRFRMVLRSAILRRMCVLEAMAHVQNHVSGVVTRSRPHT